MSDTTQDLIVSAEYISQNRIKANTNVTACIDGCQQNSAGGIARAGAHFGYIMILLALNNQLKLGLTVPQVVDKIYDYVSNREVIFQLHSDHHGTANGNLSGCGHIAKAAKTEFADKYQLNAAEVTEAFEYLAQLHDKNQNVKTTVLDGEHQEQATIINTGTTQTIQHTDGQTMYFVYDQALDQDYINKMVPQLGISQVTPDNFWEMSQLQTAATVELLAKDLTAISINLDQ